MFARSEVNFYFSFPHLSDYIDKPGLSNAETPPITFRRGRRGVSPFSSDFLFNMSSILPVENLDAAEAAAAKVVLGKLNRQLGQRDISARGLS